MAFGDSAENAGVRMTLTAENDITSDGDVRIGARWEIDYQNGGDDGDNGGCSCRSAAHSDPALPLLVLLLVLIGVGLSWVIHRSSRVSWARNAALPEIELGPGEQVLIGLATAEPPILAGISAVVDIPEGGAEGVLMTQGGRFAGVGLYVLSDTRTDSAL